MEASQRRIKSFKTLYEVCKSQSRVGVSFIDLLPSKVPLVEVKQL